MCVFPVARSSTDWLLSWVNKFFCLLRLSRPSIRGGVGLFLASCEREMKTALFSLDARFRQGAFLSPTWKSFQGLNMQTRGLPTELASLAAVWLSLSPPPRSSVPTAEMFCASVASFVSWNVPVIYSFSSVRN